MNKTVGATSLGLAVLAGMMFQTRTVGRNRTEQSQKNAAATVPAVPTTGPVSDGPWIASCNYWSAVQPVEALQSAGSNAPSGSAPADVNGAPPQLDSSQPISSCAPDPWGVPKTKNGQITAQISAIIATVPDPIHSHLALDFDRTIDALLLAAADNHYLGSYYWLPWRSQMGIPGEPPPVMAKPDAADSARERQPGLIILRYAPAGNWAGQDPTTAYQRVIYLFLIAETPALGINGNQLQNAFHYEKMLKDEGGRLSVSNWRSPAPSEFGKTSAQTGGEVGGEQQRSSIVGRDTQKAPCTVENDDQISIIGPLYSGSAASLHAGIDEAQSGLGISQVSITGITGTDVAALELNDAARKQTYISFGENVAYEQERFVQSLAATGYDLSRVAVLSEAGTVFGGASNYRSARVGSILYLRFPRELSLLRNAEAGESSGNPSNAVPTPYLNLSLKDYSADDTVPRFSTVQSPLSIEAQLMAIAHQLQRARTQFILMSASNVLDDLFLAQFLHRACPDARLVVLSGTDLLFERDTDNPPYIGSIFLSPYLLSSLDFGSRAQWLYASYESEEIYNAASYTYRNKNSLFPPVLAGYRNYPVRDPYAKTDSPVPPFLFQQIPLWAMTVGADGYYPLAILSWCASDFDAILPTIFLETRPPRPEKCNEANVADLISRSGIQNARKFIPESINENSGILPSMLWGVIAGLISAACIGHCIFLWSADLWSPFTRDLAIDSNDLPYRRAIHINIGTSVLAAMAFVTGYPLLRVGHYFHLSADGYPLAVLLFLTAAMVVVGTVAKTWRYRSTSRQPLYGFLNFVAAAALIGTSAFWMLICRSDIRSGYYSYAGLFFCYRCLRPLSGVCPLLPILLLLFAWYLWSIYSTARLRFSEIHRARLPRLSSSSVPYDPSNNPYPLFVPDNALENCSRLIDSCLYQNLTCLLITREVLIRLCWKLKAESANRTARLAAWVENHSNVVLGVIYFILFCLCLFASHIYSLDHFLFWPIFFQTSPTLYEFLIAALFFPLIMVVLSGWLRVILVWGSISRGLLEPLERVPLRFAFSRFNAGGWFSMLRQKGLHLRWRDMARSTESMRQIIHHPELSKDTALQAKLVAEYEVINVRTYALMKKIQAGSSPAATAAPIPGSDSPILRKPVEASIDRAAKLEEPCPSDCLWDLPDDSTYLCDIYHIEQAYSRFGTILIEDYLEAFWEKERLGMVEDAPIEKEKSENTKPSEPPAPTFTQMAEELIVIRYVAVIRAILVNIRYLMLFVSTAFVLALVGWNSYPFQPHAFIDWCFTFLLAVLTLGFIVVFAQMHRNAILSRLTDTTVNELGWEFYLRLITFGAIPVLTWLAYQFPQIGGTLFRIIQPGLQVVK